MIRRLWFQTPLGTIFDKIYFVLCNFRSLRQSDRNASDFLIVKNPNVLPNQPICHSLPVSDFQIQSCSIESRNASSPKSKMKHETKFSLRIFYLTLVLVVEWNRHLPSVVSSIPTGGNYFFAETFQNPQSSFSTIRNFLPNHDRILPALSSSNLIFFPLNPTNVVQKMNDRKPRMSILYKCQKCQICVENENLENSTELTLRKMTFGSEMI